MGVHTYMLHCTCTLQVIGDEGSHCSVDIHPMTGKVDPGQSEAVSIKATWHQIVRTKNDEISRYI